MLTRLAQTMQICVIEAPIPCSVAVDGRTVILRDATDRAAMARGLATVILSLGGAPHTREDARRLGRCLETL